MELVVLCLDVGVELWWCVDVSYGSLKKCSSGGCGGV